VTGEILMKSRPVWLLAVAVVVLSCASPTDGCGCTPAISAVGRVFGRLSKTSGDPVERAMVFAYVANEEGCTRHTDPDGLGETAADGSYRFDFGHFEATDSTCVLIAFRAPNGSTLGTPPDTTVTLALRFEAPIDSAQVDAIFAE
jgi:hypothetical protein